MSMRHIRRPVRAARRRGGMYVLVLGCATLVMVIGVSTLMAVRIQGRGTAATHDSAQARLYAQSAIEMALHRIAGVSNWRANLPHGAWETDRPIGAGTYSTAGIDPLDGALADNDRESVVVTGTGKKGVARHMFEVTLAPTIEPMAALGACLHAGSIVTILAGASFTASGAPLSCNVSVLNNGAITGDVQAAAVSGPGTISGTITAPATTKPMPDAGVFETYKSMATVIANPVTMQGIVLGPSSNPWGAANADGLYYIDTGGSDLTILGARIHGTLVVKCGAARKLIVDDAVFIQNFRADYPALIVDGEVELRMKSTSYGLVESTWATNFNPSSTPYQGASDIDQADSYPNEVRGLVHVKGPLKLAQSALVRGVIIAESTVSVDGTNRVTYQSSLYDSPPLYYDIVGQMAPVPGTWRRVVD